MRLGDLRLAPSQSSRNHGDDCAEMARAMRRRGAREWQSRKQRVGMRGGECAGDDSRAWKAQGCGRSRGYGAMMRAVDSVAPCGSANDAERVRRACCDHCAGLARARRRRTRPAPRSPRHNRANALGDCTPTCVPLDSVLSIDELHSG